MRIGLSATVVVFGLLLTGAVAPATAAPISYVESVSGDLATALPAPTVFTLDAGVNTVSGTLAFTQADGLERDSFAVSVPVGMQLTSIAFAFTTTLVGHNDFAEKVFTFDFGNLFPQFPIPAFGIIDVMGASPVDVFAIALPVGPGVYGIFDNGGQIGGPGFTADYTWSLTVVPTAVPEPALLVSLGAGLCGAFLRRYRHQR